MNEKEKIADFLRSLLEEYDEETEFDVDDSLITSGVLDSVAVLKIVVFLEDEFGLDFSERGIDQNDFDTLKGITSLVKR